MRIEGVSTALLWRGIVALCASSLLLREALEPSAPTLAEVHGEKPVDRPSAASNAARREVELYPAMTAHPVFEPSRQPWRPAVIEAHNTLPTARRSAAIPPQGYVLTGLVTGVHQRWALLRGNSGKSIFLTEGQVWGRLDRNTD